MRWRKNVKAVERQELAHEQASSLMSQRAGMALDCVGGSGAQVISTLSQRLVAVNKYQYSSTCHERKPSGPGKSVRTLQVAARHRDGWAGGGCQI